MKITAFILLFLFFLLATESKTGRKGTGNPGQDRSPVYQENIVPRTNALSPPASGQLIRLAGDDGFPRKYFEGRVEVYVGEKWGIVCDDNWDIQDAHVACRQLGFVSGAQEAVHSASFGTGSWDSNSILMDEVSCQGDEATLSGCSRQLQHDCTQQEAAGVRCVENGGCLDDWIAGTSGCYKLSSETVNTRDLAVDRCAENGGHLLTIETERENNFISNVLYALGDREFSGSVLSGGVRSDNVWVWQKVTWSLSPTADEDISFMNLEYLDLFRPTRKKRALNEKVRLMQGVDRKKRYSEMNKITSSTSIPYFKWFPGWMPHHVRAEPSNKKYDECIFLEKDYEFINGSKVDVGYYFWKDDSCNTTRTFVPNGFHYMCEKEQLRVPECYERNGADYRGYVSRTQHGSVCLKWNDPASTNVNPETHPGKGLGDHSYCRNPDDKHRPWCWVSHTKKTYGFCNVTECGKEQTQRAKTSTIITTECYVGNGADYRGFISTTKLGSVCLKWNDPASTNVNPETHPGKGLGDHNYCRNPDDEQRPWCWVNHRENTYGFCNVAECGKKQTPTAPSIAITTTGTSSKYKECYERNGADYRGYVSRTQHGSVCLKWNDPASTLVNPDTHPGKGLGDHSYCRNPDGKQRPWCWVNHRENTYGFCYIAACECYVRNGADYRGYVSRTQQGSVCLKWNDPASKSVNPKTHPGKGLGDHSYCRNPDDKQRPWCWVSHREKMYGFCNIAECGKEQALTAPTTTVTTTGYAAPIEVRLADGDEENSGRVEIKYLGEWGVICDDQWDIQDANVVCRMLGYDRGAIEATTSSQFGNGNGVIMLDETECTGTEESLADCKHPPWKKHDCHQWETAGVICQVAKACGNDTYQCPDGGCVPLTKVCTGECHCTNCEDDKDCNVTIQLVGGATPDEGRVEVIINGIRGTVCDDGWDENAANVICKSLGYVYGVSLSVAHFGEGSGPIWYDDIRCTGREKTLGECPMALRGEHDCLHIEDAGVICSYEKPAETVKVWLRDGRTKYEGNVMVIKDGKLGYICDDEWEDNDARVICRMLGFRGGKAYSGSHFSVTTTLIGIILDDVQCTGYEPSLSQCLHKPWGQHDCTDKEYAGVFCLNPDVEPDINTTTAETVKIWLRNGRTKYEGNVMVIKDGRLGYICDDEWEDNDARVICRMLGFQGGKAYSGGHFRAITTLIGIILDDVQCTGYEPSLSQCLHKPWGQHDCTDKEYAGVSCLNPDVGLDINTTTGSIQCGKRPLMEHQRSKRDKSEEEQIAPSPKVEHIIGGMNAVQGEIPWQVGVRLISNSRNPKDTNHKCGGTILSEYWILSAAHCFRMHLKNYYVLRTGDFNNKVDDDHEQEFKIDHLIIHERYNADANWDYDIALIKIRPQDGRGIVFNDYVQPACLPESSTEYEAGMNCHISGWGLTSDNYPSILQSARIPILSESVCNIAYKGELSPRMFCAGYLSGHVNTCPGDSGGPFACDIQGKYTVLGITSWGRGCLRPNAPGVYAKVKEVLPWIKQKMQL